MEALLADLGCRTSSVIAKVENALPKGFPAPIADTILTGVGTAAVRIGAELAELGGP